MQDSTSKRAADSVNPREEGCQGRLRGDTELPANERILQIHCSECRLLVYSATLSTRSPPFSSMRPGTYLYIFRRIMWLKRCAALYIRYRYILTVTSLRIPPELVLLYPSLWYPSVPSRGEQPR